MTDIHRFVTADEAREAALAWHYDDSQQFWSDLAEAYALFEQGAFDFPELAEEFAENGIISRQASFLARYNRWTAARAVLSDAEETNAPASAGQWGYSDDEAVDLLHEAVALLTPDPQRKGTQHEQPR